MEHEPAHINEALSLNNSIIIRNAAMAYTVVNDYARSMGWDIKNVSVIGVKPRRTVNSRLTRNFA